MRILATAIILLFGAALIVIHQRYNSAISKALEEEATPVPIPVGPIDSAGAPALRFQILNVQHNQRIEPEGGSAAPASSDWTVFDCVPVEDPGAAFRLALSPVPPVIGQIPVTSSDAILWVTGRDAGARLVDLFADVFEVETPRPRKPLAPLKAMRINVSVLGQHLPAGEETKLSPQDEDGEGSRRGPWTAARWFVEYDGLESEVWFNYDLEGGRGEIVRKNPEDSDDLLLVMATSLRDGPRPPRTPADDPSLTSVGPHVRDLRRIPVMPSSSYLFTPSGSLVLMSMEQGSSLRLVDPDHPDESSLLAQLEGVVAALLCADDRDEVFVLQETSSVSIEGAAWWQSSQHLWRIDRKRNTKQLIAGPWGENGSVSGPLALSPDGRYLVVSMRRFSDDGERIRSTYIHDFKTGQSKKAAIDSSAEVIQWSGASADTSPGPLRCSVMTGGGWRFNPDYQRQSYVLDPATGAAEPVDEIKSSDPMVSPDGRLRADLHDGDRVDLIDLDSGRTAATFTFHEDDRRHAREGTVSWLTPRYLLFRGKRHATIDVTTMKMCYLAPPNEKRTFQFSRNFDYAAATDGEGLYVGRVVIDSEPTATARSE